LPFADEETFRQRSANKLDYCLTISGCPIAQIVLTTRRTRSCAGGHSGLFTPDYNWGGVVVVVVVDWVWLWDGVVVVVVVSVRFLAAGVSVVVVVSVCWFTF
jgi:hypothetical protein